MTHLDLRSIRLRSGEELRDEREVELQPLMLGGPPSAVSLAWHGILELRADAHEVATDFGLDGACCLDGDVLSQAPRQFGNAWSDHWFAAGDHDVSRAVPVHFFDD